MARFEAFALDKELIEEGIWEPIGAGDIEFRIAWAGTREFQRAMTKKLKVHQKELRTDKLAEDEIRSLLVPEIASILVKDWKNVDDRPEFDSKFVEHVLGLPTHRHILDRVWSIANTESNYQVKIDPAAVAKNSVAPSNGS